MSYEKLPLKGEPYRYSGHILRETKLVKNIFVITLDVKWVNIIRGEKFFSSGAVGLHNFIYKQASLYPKEAYLKIRGSDNWTLFNKDRVIKHLIFNNISKTFYLFKSWLNQDV